VREELFVNVNGKELAVEIDGPDDAPVVLLVHGLGGTSNFYQPQTDALADRLRVVRVDSAGAGRNRAPRGRRKRKPPGPT